ncbi:MAG: acyltransferase [Armatimonadota bacterium]
MNKRISWIDYAKGIGIILVVYGHVLQGLCKVGLDISPKIFSFSNSLVYGFHMPLFFLLSGMFAESWLAKYKTSSAIKAKVFSILWPYLVWSLVQGAVSVGVSDYTNYPMTWPTVLKRIPLSPFLQFWFLYVLFIQHMLYLVLRRYLNPKAIAIVSLALYIVCPWLNFWVTERVFRFFIYFCLGALINRNSIESVLSKFDNKWGFSAAILGFAGINALYLSGKVDFPQFSVIIALAGVILTILVSHRLAQSSILQWLRVVGTLSMPIYLLHVMSGAAARIILLYCFKVRDVYIHAILGCATGVILPVLFYKAMTKIKANTLLFGR